VNGEASTLKSQLSNTGALVAAAPSSAIAEPVLHCERWAWGFLEKCISTASRPDDLANSFASLSVAMTLATLFLAILALATAVGWFFWVRHTSKEAARKEAEKSVPTEVRNHLNERLPAMVNEIIAPHIEQLLALARGGGQTPSEQAKAFNEEPK
jgi:hypothetical protein